MPVISTDDISISFITCIKRSMVDKHYATSHRKHNCFLYYMGGGHEFRTTDGVYTFTAGDAAYLPYSASYENTSLGDDTSYIQLDFSLYKNGQPTGLFDKPCSCGKMISESVGALLLKAWERYCADGDKAKLFCTGSVYNAADLFVSDMENRIYKTEEYLRIEKAVKFLENNFIMNTSVGELAAISSTCVSNFERIFRKYYGVGVVEYRNNLRIAKAKQLLACGASVADAAEQTGFSDTFYFSRIFKKITGETPGAYRKSFIGV